MKKFLFSLIALSFVVVSFASGTSVVPPSKKPAGIKASEMMIPLGKNGSKISLQELSQMKLKDYQLLTGKKMKLVFGHIIGPDIAGTIAWRGHLLVCYIKARRVLYDLEGADMGNAHAFVADEVSGQ